MLYLAFWEVPLFSVGPKERIKINGNDYIASDLIQPELFSFPYTTKIGLTLDQIGLPAHVIINTLYLRGTISLSELTRLN